jgi:acyl-ACP thioesterase
VSELPACELLPLPSVGRTFSAERVVRLGDVDPAGELRLDAVARYLQDVASDDALDAALPNALGWVVRRTMISIDRPAVAGERVGLTTFCTGAGRSWAERRTSLDGEHGASIEAVSLWVQVDIATGRPAKLGSEFFELYGESSSGRIVSSKLSLPGRPPEDARREPWVFRCVDLDQFGHVNNAVHWAVVEEGLQRGGVRRRGVAELEYFTPADVGDLCDVMFDHDMTWVVAHGRTLTAARWTSLD